MIQMHADILTELFPQISGNLHDFFLHGIEIDSRKNCDGVLFIAIKGENFDGHDFIDTAYKKGAVAALVQKRVDSSIAQFKVDDTRQAMAQLANYWRKLINPQVVAITGSNGKTTVKEMLGRILPDQFRTVLTEGNLNNDIGVPLTLFRLSEADRFAVIEMGANHQLEIRFLLSIAEPDIVYVNNARMAHVEGFGSIQAVIEAKGEMYQFCKPDALAVFNDDEEAVDYWKSIAATDKQLDFSRRHQCTVTGSSQDMEEGLMLTVTHQQQQVKCTLNVHGSHNAQNALAAITIGLACGVDFQQAVSSLEGFGGVKGRQQFVPGLNHSQLIDDSYNANPDSLSAAVKVLCGLKGRAWLALGDMAELGEQTEQLHKQAAIEAREAGVEQFFALGDMSCQAANEFAELGFCFNQHDTMADFIARRITSDVNLLIKGSRSAAMEKVVDLLSHEYKGPYQAGDSRVI